MTEKTIFQKMFIKGGMRLLVENLPEDLKAVYADLPGDVLLLEKPEPNLDVIHLFVTSQAELESRLMEFEPFLNLEGSYWICYPKLTSARKSDINRDTIWKYTQNFHFKAVFMIAMNDTWSALRLKREP
jgi:hypothetical protein